MFGWFKSRKVPSPKQLTFVDTIRDGGSLVLGFNDSSSTSYALELPVKLSSTQKMEVEGYGMPLLKSVSDDSAAHEMSWAVASKLVTDLAQLEKPEDFDDETFLKFGEIIRNKGCIEQSQNSIFIDDFEFRWGFLLDEFAANLKGVSPKTSDSKWQRIEFRCARVFEIPTLSGEAKSPSIKRPVTQLTFKLGEPKGIQSDVVIPFWLNTLKRAFGEPTGESSQKVYPFADPSGMVIFNAHWINSEFRIDLSVYGSVRKSKYGDELAGIFIEWKNDKEAATPYIESFKRRSEELEETLLQGTSIEVFEVSTKQSPFTMPDYASENPHKAIVDQKLRLAQKSLYKEFLLETPSSIKDKLNEYAIAIWQHEKSGIWGVSNLFDTVCYKLGDSVKVDFANLQPAKGQGGTYFSIGDLDISDKPNSDVLKGATERLEQIMSVTISRYEGHDC